MQSSGLPKRLLSACREWLTLWVGYSVLMLLGEFAHFDFSFVLRVLGQALFGLFVGCVALSRRSVMVLLSLFLLGVTTVGIAQFAKEDSGLGQWLLSQLSTVGWLHTPSSWNTTTIHSTSNQPRTWAVWALPDVPQSLQLSFSARQASGVSGWDWMTGSQAKHLSWRLIDGVVTTVFKPSGSNPFIFRRAYFQHEIAGARVRASVSMRTIGNPNRSCGAIALVASGTTTMQREPICAVSQWQTFSVAWNIPGTISSGGVDLVLNGFKRSTLQLRSPTVDLERNGSWRSLFPLSPTGIGLDLTWMSNGTLHQLHRQFRPSSAWKMYLVSLEEDSLRGATRIEAHITVEPDTTIAMSEPRLQVGSSSKYARRLVPVPGRLNLGLAHPNLAGHSVATAFIGLVGLGLPAPMIVPVMAISWFDIWLSGSRAAALGILASLGLILYSLGRRRPIRIAILAVAVTGLYYVLRHLGGLGRATPFSTNLVADPISRPDIWHLALQGLREHVLFGLRGAHLTFAQFSQAHGFPVTHAHDIWLQYAVMYGVPGVLAILWLSGGLAYVAWSRGGVRGILIVGTVFLMNVFDVSLFFSAVLVPLTLSLNALRQPSDAIRGSSSQPRTSEAE